MLNHFHLKFVYTIFAALQCPELFFFFVGEPLSMGAMFSLNRHGRLTEANGGRKK